MIDPAPTRFLLSFAAALGVTLAMLWVGLEVSGFGERQQRRELQLHEVDLASELERNDVADLLAPGPGAAPPRGPLASTEPLDYSRETRGIVQLDVRTDPTGAVVDVRVIDAVPAGVYEQQAIAQVRSRRYSPEIVDGRAVAGRRLEIVDFRVTAADRRASEGR